MLASKGFALFTKTPFDDGSYACFYKQIKLVVDMNSINYHSIKKKKEEALIAKNLLYMNLLIYVCIYLYCRRYFHKGFNYGNQSF